MDFPKTNWTVPKQTIIPTIANVEPLTAAIIWANRLDEHWEQNESIRVISWAITRFAVSDGDLSFAFFKTNVAEALTEISERDFDMPKDESEFKSQCTVFQLCDGLRLYKAMFGKTDTQEAAEPDRDIFCLEYSRTLMPKIEEAFNGYSYYSPGMLFDTIETTDRWLAGMPDDIALEQIEYYKQYLDVKAQYEALKAAEDGA